MKVERVGEMTKEVAARSYGENKREEYRDGQIG